MPMTRNLALVEQVGALRWVISHPLNRGRTLSAAARWLSWHMRAPSAPPEPIEFINGTRLYAGRGLTTANVQRYVGLGELDVMGFLLHALEPNQLFVDIGANIGANCILAAGLGADVIAFEPVAENYDWLLKNIALNDFARHIEARQAAISETSGTLTMVADGATSRVETQRSPGVVATDCIGLDEALLGRSPSIIKIDVEGYEVPALRGAARTLAAPGLDAVVCELKGHGAHYGYDEAEAEERLGDAGFTPCTYDPLARRLAALTSVAERPDNIIFVRDPPAMATRLAAAPRRETIWKRRI
jgi:FkbM family methyltransferase